MALAASTAAAASVHGARTALLAAVGGGTRRGLGAQARRPAQRSPLEQLQLDPREVKHMAPHVLSAAVSSAGSSRHRGETLWRAYGERALSVQDRFTLHDLRLVLKGFADASVRDASLFAKLLASRPWQRDAQAAPRDLCSVAVNLAKLGFSEAAAFHNLGDGVMPHVEGLETMDLARLANAFSRAGCFDHAVLALLERELTARAASAPQELAPAVVALALNAFAVCGRFDPQLWRSCLESSIEPRVAEYSVTQSALIANAAARSADDVLECRSILHTFAKHWLATGKLEREASPEDLAYLTTTFARVKLSENIELNLAFSMSALQQLSQFSAWQLALLCGSLVQLPSGGRDACLVAASQEVFGDVLQECSIGHLALLVAAFSSARAALSPALATALTRRLCDVAAAAQATGARGSPLPLTSGSLGSLLDGMVHLLSPAQCQQALAALRPLTLNLAKSGSLRPPTVFSIVGAHAHLQVRDMALLEAVCATSLDESESKGFRAERLLVSLGMLDAPLDKLLSRISTELPVMAERLSLQEVAQALLAAGVLGFRGVSRGAVESLLSRAREACVQGAAPREAARLAAASHALRLHGWATDFAEGPPPVSGPARQVGHKLEPPAPASLLREVFRALERCFGAGSVALGRAACGFQADLLLAPRAVAGGASSGTVAIEVDGPRRFYYGSRDLVGLCKLKDSALRREFRDVVRIGFWEWPRQIAEQDALLHGRLASVTAGETAAARAPG